MKRNYFIILLLIMLVLSGAFFLLPKSNCDDEPDPQLERLIDRAYSGEIEAVAALYRINKQKRIDPLEEYWALKGALLGDAGIQKEYVTIFQSRLNATEQQRVIKSIEAEIKMPGALCLLEMIRSDTTTKQSFCPASSKPEPGLEK